MFMFDQVERVYTGRKGCMCGCRGNYTSHKPTISMVMNKILSDPNHKREDNHIFLDTATRRYVAYLKEAV